MPDTPEMYEITEMACPNKCIRLEEEVQAELWASGPMLFTHWHMVLIKECGQEIDQGYILSWIVDPSMQGIEYDQALGRFYV